jgi:methionyl-tRNA formyltransferase
VILLANDVPGLDVARYLCARGDQIVRLYLHDPQRRRFGEEIAAATGTAHGAWFTAAALRDPDRVRGLPELEADYVVTVFWAHLLSDEVLSSAGRGTVNFHPALLPHNRGWFPHVHSIVDGSPAGVTLHAMDTGADAGPIWAQRELAVEPWDTAFTLQKRLQAEIVELFRETWPRIVDGTLRPTPQSEAGASPLPRRRRRPRSPRSRRNHDRTAVSRRPPCPVLR